MRRTCQEHGAHSVMHQLRARVTEHDPQKAAAPSCAQCDDRGMQLLARPPKHVDRLARNDAGASRAAADDLLRSVARFLRFLREQLGEIAGVYTGADCGSCVERCHRLNNRSFRRRNEERLAQGLETPVGPVDAYDGARECAHVSSRRRDVGHDDVRAIGLNGHLPSFLATQDHDRAPGVLCAWLTEARLLQRKACRLARAMRSVDANHYRRHVAPLICDGFRTVPDVTTRTCPSRIALWPPALP